MTAIEQLERTETRTESSLGHAARLAAVLGNGAEWTYDGNMSEDEKCGGTCACGQKGLRFLFRLDHPDGRTAIVGSSCIESYPGISPDVVATLGATLDGIKARLAEARRRAAQAGREAQIQALLGQWSALEWERDRLSVEWDNRAPYWRRFVPRGYRHGARARLEAGTNRLHPAVENPLAPWRKLATAHGQRKRLETLIGRVQAGLQDFKSELARI